ncbi:hypothetical protein LshimejAT787_0106140 [Lyophyllum shimeji]|uniref:Uncharacterized protein n=1 Tax=Lyophyllum shimeji TaxID=47721 RepID=A0A9P3UJT8_LYOSH|nr:hypothetical protein LshimejAT787_0106140 [Lyophyllum shimeji]
MSLPAPDPITLFNHLLAIPKLDKAKFISSYLQEQSAHAKTYASQGRAFVSSWKHEHAGTVTAPPQPEEGAKARLPSKLLVVDYGFGTPVLKPRVVMRTAEDVEQPAAPKDEAAITSENSHSPKKAVQPNQERHTKRKRRIRDSPAKASKQDLQSGKAQGRGKRDSGSDPEGEHANRLKDRRDRKRAKRVITKLAVEGSGTSSEKSIANRVKAKKLPKAKVPAGLALLHGFSATNVGSVRLTVKPSLSVGVFNKGKASAKTSQRPPKEAGRVKAVFAEEHFLNKKCERKKAKSKRISSSSPSASDTCTTTSEAKDQDLGSHGINDPRLESRKSRKLKDTNFCPDAVRHVVSKRTKDLSIKEDYSIDNPRKAPRPDGRPASIVWDIERDDASLASERRPSESERRSVLLDTCHLAWGDASIKPSEKGRVAALQPKSPPQELSGNESVDIAAAQRPSSSLGPSESASQYGQRIPRQDVPLQGTSSKYFIVPTIRAVSAVASPGTATCLQGAVEQHTSRVVTSCEKGPSNDNANKMPDLGSPVVQVVSYVAPVSPVYEAINTGHFEVIASSTNSLEYLPEVDPQDYRYSDGGVDLWPPEDIRWADGRFHVMTDEHGNIYTEDELFGCIGDNDTYLSFHQWHELEGTLYHYRHGGEMRLEEEADEDQTPGTWAAEEADSLVYNDDSRHPREYMTSDALDDHERSCDGFGHRSFTFDDSVNSDPGGGDQEVAYDENLESAPEEMFQLSCSGASHLCTDETDGFVDSTARFSQGRALLLGYSEQGIRPLGLVSRSPGRRELPSVEADVAKRLRNHWLPHRL